MKRELHEKFILTVKPPKTRRDAYTDTASDNLKLFVYASGRKVFAWFGRMDGKLREITLGPHPTHSLGAARKWAAEISEARNLGIDLTAKREAEAIADAEASSQNVDWLFELYMQNEGAARKSAGAKRRMYEHDIRPAIGSKRAADVTYDDLAEIIALKYATAPVMSNHLQALLARMFRWATSKGRPLTKLEVNPSTSLVKLAPPPKRSRYFTDDEIKLFLQACADIGDQFCEVLVFILHTGARKNEAFWMPWTEVDLVKGTWTLAADRSKNGKELLLSLPPVMVDLLKARHKLTGEGIYVWPGKVEGKPIGGFSKPLAGLHAVMEALAVRERKKAVKIAHWTIHDLRRTLSTGMNGLLDEDDMPLIPGDIVERVINHTLLGVAGIYNKHDYQKEKKRALQLWADHLARLSPVGNEPVVEIAAKELHPATAD